MSNVWMPLYVGDYLADTMHLTTEEHGAYLLLIMAAWKSGGDLPGDDAALSAITRLPPRRWKTMRPRLEPMFQVEGATWSHKRVTAELARAGNKSAKASQSARKRWGDADAMRTHMPSHSERNAKAMLPQSQSQPDTQDPTTERVSTAGAPRARSHEGTLGLPPEEPYPGYDLDAAQTGLAGDLRPVWAGFVEHHHGSGKLIASIPHAWRKWCRREAGFRQRDAPVASVHPKTTEELLEMAERMHRNGTA